MIKTKRIDEHIEEMRAIGEILMPHNFPKVSHQEEETVNVFKDRDVTVDGYEVTICYNKSDCDNHYVEHCQVFSRSAPFLPFHLVCKLAQKFLGDRHLSLVEVFRDNRKIYCWTVAIDKNGEAIEQPYKETLMEECTFEGFRYTYMNPKTVDFY